MTRLSWACFALAASVAGPAAAEAPDPAGEAGLEKEARLEVILRIAMDRNPDLRESRALVGAADARAEAAGRGPDLQLVGQGWEVPLSTPFDFNAARMLMVGLRKPFAPPGMLSARERAGHAEAALRRSGLEGRRLDTAAQVRRAFAEYALADREQVLHLEHMSIIDGVARNARGFYQVGRMSKPDYLRTTVELARIHTVLAEVAQLRRTSAALLNTLMARDPDAPLGPPAEVSLPGEPVLAELMSRAEVQPEVVARGQAVEREEARLAEMRAEAHWPEFMVELDYGYMPMDGTSTYTAMVGFTLPWLTPGRGAPVREAERMVEAGREALASARNLARYQIREAYSRARAARDSFDLIDQQLLPQSRLAAEAAQEAFAAGESNALGLLDAVRGLLDVRLEQARARARLVQSLADLERASGQTLFPAPRGTKP